MYAINQAVSPTIAPVSTGGLSMDSARWGSLYDALQVSQSAASEAPCSVTIVRRAVAFLDHTVPLHGASHGEVSRYCMEPTACNGTFSAELVDDREVGLRDSRQFVGWTDREQGRSLLFRNRGMHIEIQVDACAAAGRFAPGGMSDIRLELVETAAATLQAMRHHACAVGIRTSA